MKTRIMAIMTLSTKFLEITASVGFLINYENSLLNIKEGTIEKIIRGKAPSGQRREKHGC
jgi:hypothetical protein